ncbi:hypothetical protein DOT_6111 [Desulfosporosinus sp. OT]|nr:hypothetical protein DOT_6111 [Desulfosporosinus sp. OT]
MGLLSEGYKAISKVVRQAFDSMNGTEKHEIVSDQYSKGWQSLFLG